MSTHGGISELLVAAEGNDPLAWDRLMALVYDDLKRIAHGQMARIAPGQTLSTTVLVHETFEKLATSQGVMGQDRSSFYALCAYAMRQIIIDHYRRRSAAKRVVDDVSGVAQWEHARANPEADNALLALGATLDALLHRDPDLVKVFEMRYFAGLEDGEIAERLGVSVRTVQRMATRARAWVVSALDS